MELNLRTVLVVLGTLIMLGILFDGFRRMQRSRKEALNLDVKEDFKFPESSFSSELPNGGARVVGERDAEALLEDAQNFRDQLDNISGISALDQLEAEAESQLDSTIKASLHEDRIYAGEPDFQHNSYESSAENESVAPMETSKLDDSYSISEATLNSTDSDNSAFGQEASFEQEGIVEQESTLEQEAAVEKKATVEKDNFFENESAFGNNESEVLSVSAEEPAPFNDTLIPKPKPLNLDEHVPLLMDVEELGNEVEPQVIQDEDFADESIVLTVNDIPNIEKSVAGISDMLAPPVLDDISAMSLADKHDVENLESLQGLESLKSSEEPADDGRQEAAEMMAEAAYAPVKKPGPNAKSISDRPVPSLVLVTHVVPHDDDGFCGEDILYLVNSCDLRHGEKDIFHRYEQQGGEGHIQFSMAQSFNPGIFNPETLLHERIHGVSLFMSLPGPDKAMDAFEAMTEMASVIARNLGGDVHDETHSIMALQTIEHNRQQVRDFVRKQKIADKK